MSKPKKRKPQAKRDNLKSSLFSNSRREKNRAVNELKEKRSYGQIREIISELSPKLVLEVFGRNPFPRTWNEIEGDLLLPKSSSWIQEVGWLSITIELGSPQIRRFLDLRQRFGNAFITGSYQKAEEILDETHRLFGLSYWLLERRLMLAQAAAGFDGNKSALQEVLRTCSDPFVRYAATIFSSRVETALSSSKFQAQVEGKAAEIRADGSDYLASKIEFQLAPWSCGWAHAAHLLLHTCQRRPLIDLYNYTLKILCYQCSDKTVEERDYPHLKRILGAMYAAVPDTVILHLLQLIHAVPEQSTLDQESLKVIRVHDLLITNKCEEAVDAAKALILDNPISFDSYYLLGQATVATGKPAGKFFSSDSFAQRIIDRLPLALENQGNIRPHLESLLEMASKLGDNHIGLALGLYAMEEIRGSINPLMQKYVALIGKNSLAGTLQNFPEGTSAIRLKQFITSEPDSPSTILLKHNLTREGDLSGLSGVVDSAVLDLVDTTELFDRGDFSQAVESLSRRLRGERLHVGCAQLFAPRVIEKLFTARLALGQYIEAANDVIFVATRNKNYLRHVPFEELIMRGNERGGEALQCLEAWPVLHFLHSRSAQEIYRSLNTFLSRLGFAGPAQYVERIATPINDAQRFLLRDILVPQVMERGWKWVSNDDALRNLRAQVLQKLYETSSEDQELVLGQLSIIEQERAIEEEYRNIEGPKFFFDFADQHRRLLSENEMEFERYLMFKSFESAGGAVINQDDLFAAVVRSHGVKEKERPEADIGLSPAQTVLMQFAHGCFVSYLWGPQSSLNSMLGTRVRHGALENQLARAFDSADLLAKTTDGVNYYIPTAIEKRISHLSEHERDKISEATIRFSKKIYERIEHLVSEMLRIRVPDSITDALTKQGYPADCFSQDGLLDFSALFEMATVGELVIGEGLDTAVTFLNKCRKVFESAALRAFSAVQDYLDSTVAPYVASVSETMEAEIHDVLEGDEVVSVLANEVALAKDTFGNDIRIVKEWFSISENLEEISGSIQSIIEMAFRVVNFASSGGLGRLVNNGIASGRVEGLARLMFYEVLLIVFRNIVKHASAVEQQEVRVSLAHDIAGGIYTFRCVNLLGSEDAVRRAVSEAKRCRDELPNNGVLAHGPGKTGIRRIPLLFNNLSEIPAMVEVAGIEKDFSFEISIKFAL